MMERVRFASAIIGFMFGFASFAFFAIPIFGLFLSILALLMGYFSKTVVINHNAMSGGKFGRNVKRIGWAGIVFHSLIIYLKYFHM